MRLGGGVFHTRHRLELQHTKVDALGAKTIQRAGLIGKRLAAVKAVAGIPHKHIHVGAANGETGQLAQRGDATGHHVGKVGLLETKRPLHIHELRNLQRGLTGKNANALALKVERDRVGNVARGNRQVAGAARKVQFFAR